MFEILVYSTHFSLVTILIALFGPNSFANHGGFHEQCIELIFKTLKNDLSINHLEVCGRFQRRGGIDINPIRGSHNKKLFVNFREFNQ